MTDPSYEKYVKDEAFLAYYNNRRERYAGQITERQGHGRLGAENTLGKGSLLSIGCSTSNLVLHIIPQDDVDRQRARRNTWPRIERPPPSSSRPR